MKDFIFLKNFNRKAKCSYSTAVSIRNHHNFCVSCFCVLCVIIKCPPAASKCSRYTYVQANKLFSKWAKRL